MSKQHYFEKKYMPDTAYPFSSVHITSWVDSARVVILKFECGNAVSRITSGGASNVIGSCPRNPTVLRQIPCGSDGRCVNERGVIPTVFVPPRMATSQFTATDAVVQVMLLSIYLRGKETGWEG